MLLDAQISPVTVLGGMLVYLVCQSPLGVKMVCIWLLFKPKIVFGAVVSNFVRIKPNQKLHNFFSQDYIILPQLNKFCDSFFSCAVNLNVQKAWPLEKNKR